MCHGVYVPIEAVDLVTPDVVGRYHSLAGNVDIRRVKNTCNLGFCATFVPLTVDPIQNALLLNESSRSVHIQENSVSEETRLSEVAGPHLQVVAGNVNFVVLMEILRKLSDLLEILSTQDGLDEHVKEVKHLF